MNQVLAIAFLILWAYCSYYEYYEDDSIFSAVSIGFLRAACSAFLFIAFIYLFISAVGVKS